MDKDRVAAVIPGAGSGERLGLSESKLFLLLGDKPVLVHTLEKLQQSPIVDEVVLVVRRTDLSRARALVTDYRLAKVSDIIEGGDRRQDSVYLGLRTLLGRGVQYVFIHDAVRPFFDAEQIPELLEATKVHGAAILAIRPKDTIKLSDGVPFVQQTLERSKLWAVQTPQCFEIELLMKAYRRAMKENFVGTDDASLVERLGVKVRIVEGSHDNIKITTKEDLELAELILRRQPSGRVKS